MNFTITPEALAYILKAKKAMGRDEPYLRIGIKGQSCCGPAYDVHFADVKTENDAVFEQPGLTVLIDKKFEQVLNNAEMITVKAGIETKLKINNPNVRSHCTCHG